MNKTIVKHTAIVLLFLVTACHQSTKKENAPETKVQEVEIPEEKADTIATNQIQKLFNTVLRPDKPVLFNEIYTDTITFKDYDDDFDYWYLIGSKNGANVSLIYNWDWTKKQNYNFRPGDLIAVQWKMDSIVAAGDEENVTMVERALDAQRIAQSDRPIKFLSHETVYDEALESEVSSMVLNASFIQNISIQQKAALGFIAFDIGNECEWGYDSEGNGRVLWCRIVSALDLGHQCSDTQLNFLRKWFSKDTLALKKLKSCRTMPNTATVQTTFDEILIQTNESKKTITIDYKITDINLRASESWQWSQTDVFEYGPEHIVLVNSKKTDLTEDEINMNPDAVENINPQNFVLALKDHILNEWKKKANFDALKITFINNILNIKGNEGFTLSNYDFNEMVINGTNKPQTIYLTITNEGGNGGGNVALAETYSLMVLDAEHFDIKHVEPGLAD